MIAFDADITLIVMLILLWILIICLFLTAIKY